MGKIFPVLVFGKKLLKILDKTIYIQNK